MAIANVSTLFSRIAKGSEGGNEFARFVKLLLTADYASQGVRFIAESDSSGDYKKVDAHIIGSMDFPGLITGFQFKFYPSNLSTTQKRDIEESIEKALKENPLMQEFYLITPEDFLKEQQAWFDKLRARYEKEYHLVEEDALYRYHFHIHHFGHNKIVELSLKHDYIGRHYFPELFSTGVGKFKLTSATIDSNYCSWLPSKHRLTTFYQCESTDQKTTDPVFDFQFKNSTADIRLLNKIEIHIENIWTDLKGFPKKQVLRSVGTLVHYVDFSTPINVIPLNDPLIIEANTAKRFKIQLESFAKKCPGNYSQLKFWFYFDEITIPTNSFVLDF